MARALELAFKLGNLRHCVFNLRRRPNGIQPRDEARLLAALGYAVGALLGLEIALGYRDFLLETPVRKIVLRDFRGDCYPRRRPVRERRLVVGCGGFNRAARATENVDFPSGGCAHSVGRARGVYRLALFAHFRVYVECREEPALGYPECRARLCDFLRSCFYRQIAVERAGNKGGQLGVAEELPPLRELFVRDRRAAPVAEPRVPVFGEFFIGRFEVGADRTAAERGGGGNRQKNPFHILHKNHSYLNASIGSRRAAFHAG